MQKILNADKAHAAMAAAGLSQRAVADALGVSREAVSQWLRAQSFPRPNKLLQLGKLLDLSFGELVRVDDPAAPRVAFRKVRGTKTLDHHIEKAQEMQPDVIFMDLAIFAIWCRICPSIRSRCRRC